MMEWWIDGRNVLERPQHSNKTNLPKHLNNMEFVIFLHRIHVKIKNPSGKYYILTGFD